MYRLGEALITVREYNLCTRMQITSKSNLKLVLITFPVLNFEVSTSGKRMWEKSQEDIWKQCFYKMSILNFYCHYFIQPLAHKRFLHCFPLREIWHLLSLCGIWHLKLFCFLLWFNYQDLLCPCFCAKTQVSYFTAWSPESVAVQHREMSTDLTMAQSEGIWVFCSEHQPW